MAACFGKCFNGRRRNAHQWEQQIQESSHHHSSHHSSPIKYPQTKEKKMSVVMEGTNEMSMLSDKGSVFSAQASVRGTEAASFDDGNLASTSGGAYSIAKHSNKQPAAALQQADANAAQQSAGKRTLPSQLPATRSAEDHERNDTPQSGAATQEAASQQAVETPAGRGGERREGEGDGAGGGLAQIPRLDLVSIGIPYTDPETIQKQRRDSIGSSILSADSVFGTHRSMGDGVQTNRSNISTRQGQSGTWNVAGIPQSVTIASLADPSPGRLSKQAADFVVSEGGQHSPQKQAFLEQKLAQRTALVPLPSTATATATKNMEVSAQPTLMLGRPTLMLGSYKKEAVGQPKPLAVKPLCVGGALGTRGDSGVFLQGQAASNARVGSSSLVFLQRASSQDGADQNGATVSRGEVQQKPAKELPAATAATAPSNSSQPATTSAPSSTSQPIAARATPTSSQAVAVAASRSSQATQDAQKILEAHQAVSRFSKHKAPSAPPRKFLQASTQPAQTGGPRPLAQFVAPLPDSRSPPTASRTSQGGIAVPIPQPRAPPTNRILFQNQPQMHSHSQQHSLLQFAPPRHQAPDTPVRTPGMYGAALRQAGQEAAPMMPPLPGMQPRRPSRFSRFVDWNVTGQEVRCSSVSSGAPGGPAIYPGRQDGIRDGVDKLTEYGMA